MIIKLPVPVLDITQLYRKTKYPSRGGNFYGLSANIVWKTNKQSLSMIDCEEKQASPYLTFAVGLITSQNVVVLFKD